MRWSDIPWQPPASTLRWFAAICLVWFLGLAYFFWVYRENEPIAILFLLIALTIGTAGLIHPPAIRFVFVASIVVTFPIGWLISRIMLGFVFYCLFTPLGLFFRLTGRDALGRRLNKDSASYWSAKPETNDLRGYFHQS
ncbi:MAG TPA: SxtJ family membrane protein [Gemmata sp.]|nr:SxtJ family membrane protein [Gemmata sp.]